MKKNILASLLNKRNIFDLMLVGMIAIFTSSCVQGDLYDEFYEDLDGLLPRSRKGKDIMCQFDQLLPEAQNFVSKDGFSNTENECFAYALCYFGGGTPFQRREQIGIKLYGNNEYWPIYYMNAVKYCNGVSPSYDEEEDIIWNAVGAKPCSGSFKSNQSAIIGITKKHFGAYDANDYEYDSNTGKYYIWLNDQTGRSKYSQNEIDAAYQLE